MKYIFLFLFFLFVIASGANQSFAQQQSHSKISYAKLFSLDEKVLAFEKEEIDTNIARENLKKYSAEELVKMGEAYAVGSQDYDALVVGATRLIQNLTLARQRKTRSGVIFISPEMIGFTFGVHNGKTHLDVLVSEDMIGHRLGEFSPTKKFIKHGGRMQKELEQKKKEGEIAAAQSAKAVTEPAAGAKK